METTINDVFQNVKTTENGDLSYSSTGNNYVDLLFFAEKYTQDESAKFTIGTSDKDKLFSMMIRDPRFGFGFRKFGRKLMEMSNVSLENRVKAGRFDDLLYPLTKESSEFLKTEIQKGNELTKKWMPRFSSSNKKKILASKLSKMWGMNKIEYNKFVKVQTTESLLTERKTDDINFSSVPSIASLKYANRFSNGEDTKERYAKWLEDVKSGKENVNISTTTVYDIFKNREKIDADLFFSKLEKIKISCIPVVDTSGSMYDCFSNEAGYKALAVGHYLAKCSTFMPNNVITFSSIPKLIDITEHKNNIEIRCYNYDMTFNNISFDFDTLKSEYEKEIATMLTGDCSNTNLSAVFDLLSKVSPNNFPDYIVVLSDMEFDCGSSVSRESLEQYMKANNIDTKIIWWNFNSRNTTVPEIDKNGNIFLSGYSPMLLKFMSKSFDANAFVDELIENYKKNIK